MLAAGETGTISFGTNDVKINAASVTAQDNLRNTWTITTVGTTSYTASGSYYQVGSSNKPATSITFTTTLPQSVNITNLSAKFGGFGDTAGEITLKVSETVVGSGNLNETNDVTVENTSTATGTVLTVTVTDIAKGVKCYYISYTYEIDVPEYNVYWDVNNVRIVTDVVEKGSRVTLPSKPADCSNNVVFVGWTAQNNVNGAKPSDLFNASTPLLQLPTINKETTFHAVFAEVVDGVGTFAAGESGTFKLYAIVNGNNYYAGTGIDDRKLTSTTAIANAGDYTITYIGGDQYTIQYDNQYISHANGKVDLAYLEYNEENKSKCHWTITRTGTNGTWRVASPVDNDRALVFTTDNNNSNVFKAYATSNITADGAYYDLEIGNGEAISYQNYTTTCTTDVTVTLDPNGGTGDFTDWDEVDGNYTQTVEKGYSVTLPTLNDQTAYTFGGWSDGTNTYTSEYTPQKNITLTAQWTPISYTITYNLNGGTNHASNPANYTIETSTITLQAPTKTGYTFGGWYKEDAFTNPVTQITTGSIGEIILYAKWTPNTYTVQFDANEGTGEMENQSFTYDAEPIALSANTFEREGYNFNSWNTAADGTGTPYADKAEVKNLTAEPNSVVTLYAQWTAKNLINYRTLCTYEITYEETYGVDHSNPDTYTAANLPLTFEAPTSTRDGYTFNGWSPASLDENTRGDQTVTAQWAAIHTITWMVNGSQAEGDPTTSVVNGQTITTLPTTPDVDCNGKVFVGWTTAEIVGETATIPDPLYTKLGDFPVVTSNMTFYAVFANGSGDERWIETEIGDIEATDEVVIAMQTSDKTYAMYINDDATATPDAIVVEPSDLTSASGIAAGSIWFIEKDGNGKLIIHPKKDIEKNLYCNPSTDNDRVRVGKSHANHELYKTFEIDGNYLKNSVTQHYIGVNFTNYLWYGYANNSNFPDQTLKFYKKTTVYTSYTNYSTSCVAGEFDITNTDPIYVTSAVGQKIKATDKLVLTTTDMAVGTEILLSAPNIIFYKEGIEITQLTTTAASETFELEIAYQPTISNTTEQPTITLEILGYQFTFNNKITGRSLPETFAIVAKVGNVWYALPSQGLNSGTTPVGYPVEVDNNDNPIAVTSVPANADWSLRQVLNDRFTANGENLVFVNAENKTLYANNGNANIQTYAEYTDYAATNPERYEWVPTTTDLTNYTLKNVGRDKDLSINVNATFGTHASNIASSNIRFLPIQDRYTLLTLQVVEWKENSVVIMYNGDPAQTASVSVNGAAAQNTTLSAAQCDIAVYELAATGLAANPTQRLSITIGTEKVILSIPYIISGTQTDYELLPGSSVSAKREAAKIADLIVLNAATLTAVGSKSDPYKFRNVTIYGGGSLIIPAEKGFGASTITMRVGGVEDGQYKNLYPQLQLKGTLTNTSGQINLDYLTTNDFYYPLSVPYSVTISDIQYPVGIYGANVTSNNTGSFQFKYYDGAERAAGRTGWIVLDETANPTLNPNTGYAIWGIPKKVKVNGGESTRQKFGIHRLPLKQTAANMMISEQQSHSATINVYNGSKRDSDNGWNYLGNPYLSHYGDFTTADNVMKLGKLVWDEEQGAWVVTDEEQRYVVFTNDCQNYTAELASTTAIPAFSAFFIQADQGGAINFTSPNVAAAQSLAARHSEEETKEITTGIILSGEKHSDRTGLLIADQFTQAYEFNADLSKFDNQDMNLYTISSSGKLAFMAINEDLAKQTIPLGYSVSIDGMYTIAFDEQRYSRNDIYALYLIDYDRNETTNLLHMDYNFYSETGAHAERFALQVAFAPKTPTDVEYTQVGDVLLSREGNTLRLDNLPSDATVTVYDAVGHLVEQHTASQLLQLTLQKGYYLLHIGNNQNSVVIDTFIP